MWFIFQHPLASLLLLLPLFPPALEFQLYHPRKTLFFGGCAGITGGFFYSFFLHILSLSSIFHSLSCSSVELFFLLLSLQISFLKYYSCTLRLLYKPMRIPQFGWSIVFISLSNGFLFFLASFICLSNQSWLFPPRDSIIISLKKKLTPPPQFRFSSPQCSETVW